MKSSLLCPETALSQPSIIAQYSKQNMIKFSQQPCWIGTKFKISRIVKWFYETELQAIYLYILWFDRRNAGWNLWICNNLIGMVRLEIRFGMCNELKIDDEKKGVGKWLLKFLFPKQINMVNETVSSAEECVCNVWAVCMGYVFRKCQSVTNTCRYLYNYMASFPLIKSRSVCFVCANCLWNF